MQDVNNDMDDLFRKAAEQYPLQTGNIDWDKVLAGLKDENDAPAPLILNDKQKRSKRALWLLLLLPLCLLYVTLHNHSFTPLSTKKEDAGTKSSSAKNHNDAVTNNTIQARKPTTGKDVNNNKNSIQKSADNTIINSHVSAQNFNANGNRKLVNTNAVLIKNKTIKTQILAADALTGNRKINAGSTNRQVRVNEEKNIVLGKNNSVGKQPGETSSRIEKPTTEEENNKPDLQKKAISNDTTLVKKSDSVIAKNDTAINKKKKTAKPQMQWQKGFYWGLTSSFDASTIKLQRINKIGYSLQALLGYRFSKHLSAETGLGWSLKNYYSIGKYFDKKKTNIPDVVDIYYSNGACKMLEIPVNLKYDFAIHKKSNLFVTGGLSSYIMKKENYSYRGNFNMMRVYDTTRSYKNSGNNLLSVVNVSIGYQWQLNKHSALRIEPYVKLPLHGIGIANMPITSTGISVGFTRKF